MKVQNWNSKYSFMWMWTKRFWTLTNVLSILIKTLQSVLFNLSTNTVIPKKKQKNRQQKQMYAMCVFTCIRSIIYSRIQCDNFNVLFAFLGNFPHFSHLNFFSQKKWTLASIKLNDIHSKIGEKKFQCGSIRKMASRFIYSLIFQFPDFCFSVLFLKLQ